MDYLLEKLVRDLVMKIRSPIEIKLCTGCTTNDAIAITSNMDARVIKFPEAYCNYFNLTIPENASDFVFAEAAVKNICTILASNIITGKLPRFSDRAVAHEATVKTTEEE